MQDDPVLHEREGFHHRSGGDEAVRMYAPAARIHDLRKKGIGIKTESREYRNRAGNKVRYAIYSLEVQSA